MYSRFGADVTVFQRGDRLLPREEPDVSAVIGDVFAAEGIDVRTGTAVTGLSSRGDDIAIEAGESDDADAATASDVLLAAGR